MPKNPYKEPEEVRDLVFSMRVNEEENGMLNILAAYMDRTRSDVVRILVQQAYDAIGTWADASPESGLKLTNMQGEILAKLDRLTDRIINLEEIIEAHGLEVD